MLCQLPPQRSRKSDGVLVRAPFPVLGGSLSPAPHLLSAGVESWLAFLPFLDTASVVIWHSTPPLKPSNSKNQQCHSPQTKKRARASTPMIPRSQVLEARSPSIARMYLEIAIHRTSGSSQSGRLQRKDPSSTGTGRDLQMVDMGFGGSLLRPRGTPYTTTSNSHCYPPGYSLRPHSKHPPTPNEKHPRGVC